MIKIGDDYGIAGNDYGYSLQRKAVVQSDTFTKKGEPLRKAGDEYWVSMESYHKDVAGCIDKLIKILRREAVAGEDMTLTEAAEKFREIERRVLEWAGDAITGREST